MARDLTQKKEQLPSVIDFAMDAADGLNDLTTQDMAIPFFSVLQKMSPQIDTIDGAKAGHIFNSVTEELFDTLTVIPCAYKREFVEWHPREQGGGFVGTHAIDSDVVSKATRTDVGLMTSNGTMLVETANHFVLAVTDKGIDRGLIAMTSTQLKKNRRWNSLMSGLKLKDGSGKLYTPARYSHQYTLSSLVEKNDKGSWHGWVIEMAGPVQDPDLYALAKEFSTSVREGSVQTAPPAPDAAADIGDTF